MDSPYDYDHKRRTSASRSSRDMIGWESLDNYAEFRMIYRF